MNIDHPRLRERNGLLLCYDILEGIQDHLRGDCKLKGIRALIDNRIEECDHELSEIKI